MKCGVGFQVSRMVDRVSRSCRRTAGPTLPMQPLTRVVATARMCWHCAAEVALSPLWSSASIMTSEPLSRRVLVSGTTWTTFGPPRRICAAVTMTAGRRSPASVPVGAPRSSSTTSPCVSIEPRQFVVAKGGRQVLPDGFLFQKSCCASHDFGQRLTALGGQLMECVACGSSDANGRGVSHELQNSLCRQNHLQQGECHGPSS